MNTHLRLRPIALVAFGSLLAAAASAQDSGPYVGLSVGTARTKIDEPRITAGLLGAGFATTGFARDERDTAYRLFGGYQINRNFALEASYFDLGKYGFTASTTPAGTLAGQIKLKGGGLDLVGTLPLTDSLSLLGRVGGQVANARDNFSGTGAVAVLNPTPSHHELNPKLGAGLQYAFSPGFLMRVEGERYRINDAVGNRGNVDVLSVSLVFPFGRDSAPQPRVAQAPAYVAPPPAPEPAPAPPPPVVEPAPAPAPIVAAPERRRVTFSAESLFSFDKSAIKPEGRVALDRFAAETRGTRFEMVIVEGHTDRLGSPAYNQALSERRAAAVKAYLVSSGGFDAAKVSAVGKGETQPVTQAGECKGRKQTPTLIACLQRDRRVEIEVTGTR